MKKYLEVGERLKKLRGKLSQEEFAKKIGVSHKAYQRYEYGESIPKAQTLNKIAEKESVTMHWIMTGRLRGLEEMILAEESGIPFSHLNVSGDELKLVDRLRKKGFSIPPDIINLTDATTYGAAMKLFWESSDIYDFINMIFYLKQQGKFQEVSEMMRKIGRIFFEGNKTKLEALRSFLEALAPGEKKFDTGTKLDQKPENNNPQNGDKGVS